MNYRILETETPYAGFLKLNRYRLRHELFAGGDSEPLIRERVEMYHAASVLPYDPARDAVVLIEQFRIGALEHPGGAWVLEVVGGIVERGEPPAAVARRETREEAGREVLALEKVCDFMVSPGTSTERIHLYCARVDSAGAGGIHGLDHEGEDIRAAVMPFESAAAELYGGRINSTSSIIAMQWLLLNRERLRREWA